MSVICRDFLNKATPSGPQDRATQPVLADIDRLLNSKTSQELSVLETQVTKKLHSDEPIDVEYWEQLLGSIGVFKAKAELDQVYKAIIDSRLTDLRKQQAVEATNVKEKLGLLLSNFAEFPRIRRGALGPGEMSSVDSLQSVSYSRQLDPEPFLKLRPEDKGHEIVDEGNFLDKNVSISSSLLTS